MVTATESKAALERLVVAPAVARVDWVLRRVDGSFQQRRLQLLDAVPEVVGYYADGSAALAADFYDDARAAAGARGAYVATPVVLDRTEKIRRAVVWASEPIADDNVIDARDRFARIVTSEVARPYSDTILHNTHRDKQAVGWKRIAASDACGFCRMLADKGAIYRESTALFAAHRGCTCTAAPAFVGGRIGPEANVMQYLGSRKSRSAKDRARLREYIATYYGD